MAQSFKPTKALYRKRVSCARGRQYSAGLTVTSIQKKGLYALAIFLGISPLWAGTYLPAVDLPQHLSLISVLHRLTDASTLYPEFFEARGTLTPYLGYYYVVHLLHWLMPLDLANRLFLTACVASFPLALGFLLRSLRYPRWPSLLALPFVYGDSFAWGFVNYNSSLPLALMACGFMVRTVEEPSKRKAWSTGLAFFTVAVLLFHVQVFAFLAFALPCLLLMSRAPEDKSGYSLKARKWALLAVTPGVALFLVWVGLRVGEPTEIAPGVPWKARGAIFSSENMDFRTLGQNLAEAWRLPANMLMDSSDRLGFNAALLVCGIGILLALRQSVVEQKIPKPSLRLVVLAALAWTLFFVLPFDVHGYMYYLNSRYVHLAWPLLLVCLPRLHGQARALALCLAVFPAGLTAYALVPAVREFNNEFKHLEYVSSFSNTAPKVMGLVYNTRARGFNHPLFLHAAAFVARDKGGVSNFSFATTPHSPLKYRGEPPPTFPSEWRPDQFRYDTMGRWYDTFLIRGAPAERLFGPYFESEIERVAQSEDFVLVRRKR